MPFVTIETRIAWWANVTFFVFDLVPVLNLLFRIRRLQAWFTRYGLRIRFEHPAWTGKGTANQ